MKIKKITCAFCKHIVEVKEDVIISKICPMCKKIYWDKPNNEIILLQLQDQYLDTKDPIYLGKMYPILAEIIQNLVYNKLSNSGKYIEPMDIEDIVSETITKLLKYYKKGWRCQESFTGYLQQMILHPMYNSKKKKRESIEISLYSTIKSDSNKEITILDQLSKKDSNDFDNSINNINKTSTIDFIQDCLEDIFIRIANDFGIKKAILNIALIHQFLKGKNKQFFIRTWKQYDNDVRIQYDNTLMIIFEILKKNIDYVNYKEVTNGY